MLSRIRRPLPSLLLAVLASSAGAQFDVNWVTFAPDANRLKNPNGTTATQVTGDTLEKDMAAGDLDKNGWVDLVIVRKNIGTVSGGHPNFLLMNEQGVLVDRTAQFASASDVAGDSGFLSPTNDRDVVIADVNNDTWLDVITAPTVSAGLPKHVSHPRVYRNLGSSGGVWLGLRFEDGRIPTLTPTPNFCGVAAGDVTGDGFADLYFADYGDLSDKLLINDGAGNFSDSGTARLTAGMLDAAFATAADIVDMNGDGWRDIVRSSGVTGAGAGPMVSVAYNDPGNPGFFPSGLFQSQVGTSAPYHVDVGDLNNDGKPEFITSDDGADGYRYNTGNDALGRVAWGPVKVFGFVTGGDTEFAGTNLIVDLDGDGWNDAVISDVDVDLPSCSTRCHIYHNPGGAVGSQPTLREEAGSSPAWRGVVGMLAGDLTGTFDTAVFDIDNDGDLDMVLGRCTGTFVWMNQKFQPTVVTSYCAGDGSSVACPCGGVSGAGNGCPSSVSATGARLAGSGMARIAADSLVLTSTLVPNGPGLYFQGSGQTDVVFGDGKLCAGVGIIRMGVVFAAASTSSYPGGLTPLPIHTAGATSAGDVRHYQTWYRDSAAFCTTATYNLTNGVTLSWAP